MGLDRAIFQKKLLPFQILYSWRGFAIRDELTYNICSYNICPLWDF